MKKSSRTVIWPQALDGHPVLLDRVCPECPPNACNQSPARSEISDLGNNSTFVDKQRKFVEFCRKGGTPPGQNAEIYRDLIWKSVKSALDKAYPIARHALGDQWDELCRDFFAEAEIPSPELWKMPRALCEYVKTPQLADLLRFEWLEIEVHMMPDRTHPPYRLEGETSDPLVLNPHFSIDHFHYPVFRVPYAELQKGDFYLLSFRHPDELNVCFIELGPIYVRIIEKLALGPCPVDDGDFVRELIKQRAILGYILNII